MPDYQVPASWLTPATAEPLGLLLVLRAFASGSVALTGTQAVSNGVPAFKRPETRNAQIVITLMGLFFALIFLGLSFLAGQLGVLPDPTEQETVVSQVTRSFVGAGTPFHYLVQVSTAVLLVLAANTSFADFPRLSSFLARDGFMPRIFQFRGDRLAFTSGIVLLTSVAIILIVAFGASVTALIPLYTVGVFIAFTLSQAGMVALVAVRAGKRGSGGAYGVGADHRGRGRRSGRFQVRAGGVGGAHPDPAAGGGDAVHQAPVRVIDRATRSARQHSPARAAAGRAGGRARGGHQPRRRPGHQRGPFDRRRRAGGAGR
jgi:hypothetical protein